MLKISEADIDYMDVDYAFLSTFVRLKFPNKPRYYLKENKNKYLYLS